MDLTPLVPFIPQLITAVASLGGVLIGLLINGRRESKRFAAQMSFERKKFAFDRVREVAVRLIATHREQLRQFSAYHYEDEALFGSFSMDKLREVSTDRYAAESELGLLVPHLQTPIDDARSKLWILDETENPSLMSGGAWHEAKVEYSAALKLLEVAIREVLAIDVEKSPSKTQIES